MEWKSDFIQSLTWEKNVTHLEEKQQLASFVAGVAKEGEIIGVGSGSSSYLALKALARRIKEEDIHILAIPTSLEIAISCIQLGIPTTDLNSYMPDWGFDGADEVDANHNLIKGRGGAMFKEKLLIASSPKTYILADSSKKVERLGSRFPVPVEIYPTSLCYVEKALEQLNPLTLALRMAEGKDGPVITENGNLILDVWFNYIPSTLEKEIKQIPGVIESGLFMGYSHLEILTSH